MTDTAPRIAKIILRDFRAFPGNEPCTFNLGDGGQNLLLFGENGSGKSSVFHALRLLLSETPPSKRFAHWRHVFTAGEEGTITVELTAGSPKDFSWNFGELHPAADATDVSFLELARRATFLDYKALLKTSFLHEEEECVNLFPLLISALVRDAKLPDGRTAAQQWDAVQRFEPAERPPAEPDEGREDVPTPEDQINEAAEAFRQQLGDFLNVSAGANRSLVDRANELLRQLTSGLAISTEVGTFQVVEVSSDPSNVSHKFSGAEVRLAVTYAGHLIDHPAVFLNEGRLTAIGLAIYLAAALASTPSTRASSEPRLLVLDDALIGLDLSNRLPLLDLLRGDDFKDWQVLLMTYDANWFDLASDHLPNELWVKMQLNAKPHADGWDMPVLVDDASYLARAWNHIESGDPKSAAVYLRSAWENVLRRFCEARPQIKLPLQREPRDYTAETLWSAVKSHKSRSNHRLVDDALAGQIDLCQRYILNPLCHDDPARPIRDEARRAYSAVSRLKVLLEQESSWFSQLDSRLRAATKDILGDNEKLRQRALRGLAPPNDLALALVCKLLDNRDPPLSEVAVLLRSAFDQSLWAFCARKKIDFTVCCDDVLTTDRLWQQAAHGPGALNASQPAFVATIENHRDLMLVDAPDVATFAGKSSVRADLETLRDCLRGASPLDNPKCVMSSW
jgi:energy-coupling factor transporter ATP-binding protein EcfA2